MRPAALPAAAGAMFRPRPSSTGRVVAHRRTAGRSRLRNRPPARSGTRSPSRRAVPTAPTCQHPAPRVPPTPSCLRPGPCPAIPGVSRFRADGRRGHRASVAARNERASRSENVRPRAAPTEFHRTGSTRHTRRGLSANEPSSSSMGEREEVVDRSHSGRAFPDRRRHTLCRTGANVTDCEQPRVARLVGQRLPVPHIPSLVQVRGRE